MLRIRAFQGLVPDPTQVADITCVPYDVLNADEARVLAEGKPNTLLRVDRAELELPPETNPYSDAVYARAKENFARLQSVGALRRESAPANSASFIDYRAVPAATVGPQTRSGFRRADVLGFYLFR